MFQNSLHRIFTLIAAGLLLSTSLKAQEILAPDSVSFSKTWLDKNGSNRLDIKVNATCNLDRPPYDGHESLIECTLKNKKYSLQVAYNEENYQMKMILFHTKDIWVHTLNGVQAVFIPFFYCGNSDSQVTVSYIIFYNEQSYLYHVNFYCNEDGDCKPEDDIRVMAKDIQPKALRDIFVQRLSAKYKTGNDFYLTTNGN